MEACFKAFSALENNIATFSGNLDLGFSFFIISIIGFCLFFSYIFKLFSVSVNFGRPLENKVLILYKYACQGKYNSFQFYELLDNFPTYKGIKLCYYGPKANHIEHAYGLLLEIQSDRNLVRNDLFKKRFSIFNIPEITYAAFITLPVIVWLPKYMSHWLVIAVGYYKLNKFSQMHNLCGYPVIELYSQKQILLIIPLLRQDDFVVWEAKGLVNGQECSALLQPLHNLPFKMELYDSEKILTKVTQKIKAKKKKG